MARRAGPSFLFCFAAILACLLSGCTGTPANFFVVTLVSTFPMIGQGKTVTITAFVTNDTAGAGVTFTLIAPNPLPPEGDGTLTQTNKLMATYTAPAAVPAGTSFMVTVKAVSVSFPNQSNTISITVVGPPQVTTTSLPNGNYGSPYTATINELAGVPPFTWTISSGSLTVGLSLGASTTSSVQITGTPVAQVNSNFTIKVTDSTGAFGTQALIIAIGPPLPLAVVEPQPLLNGDLNASYPGATLQATGGIPPFTWTLTSAPSTFPPGLVLSPNGLIAGAPTVAGTFNFTVQVSDSETPPMVSAPANLSITVVNLSLLQGSYTFTFSGFNSAGAVVAGGAFTADGKGNITSGMQDFNTLAGPPKNQTFTGTYTLEADGRGALTLTSLTGPPVFDFAIDSTGSHGRFIEFDSSGVRGSGQIEKQSVTTCTSTTIDGNYVFGITGNTAAIQGQSPAGPVAMAGRFTATPGIGGSQGSLSLGEMDPNAPNFTQPLFPPVLQTLSGSFGTTSQSARCTMNIVPQQLPGMNFSVYPISATQAFLVETDQVSSTAPYITTGEIDSQAGAPFSAPSAFSGTHVAGVPGQALVGNSYVPDDAVVWMSPTGGGTFTMSVWENQGGTFGTFGVMSNGTPQPVTANYSVDSGGRVTSNLKTPFNPTFYIINSSQYVMISNVQGEPMLGAFDAQSAGPFDALGIQGTFIAGTSAPPVSAVTDISGVITLDGVSAVSGTEDISAAGGNTAAQAVTGTYQGINSSFGNGTFTLTSPSAFTGVFLIASPTQLVLVQSSSGPDPILLFLGN